MRPKTPRRRSLSAQALSQPLYRQRKVKPQKGKGAYQRRPKHRGGADAFLGAILDRRPNPSGPVPVE